MTLGKVGEKAEEHRFNLSGGALCLDFANTVGDRPQGKSERLGGYEDLVRWSRQTSLLTEAQAQSLERRAARSPKEAGRAFERALQFRENLYRVFSALAAGARPATPDLDRLNQELAEAMSHLRICSAQGDCRWKWSGLEKAWDGMLWPVARNAADLLTSPEVERIRECASETCSWLFLDRSRNRCRRWCDMKSCGNRHKARRFYRRKRRKRAAELRGA